MAYASKIGRHRLRAVAVGVAVLALLAGASPAHTEPVTIGSTATGHLLWIADSKGYFKEAGVDVKMVEFSSGVNASRALLDSEVMLANSSEFAFVDNVLRHRDLRILTGVSRVNSAKLFAHGDRGITSVQDLVGRRIGVTRHSIGEFFLGEYLSINGLSIKDVTLVDLHAPDIVTEIANGTIDAAITWEPFVMGAASALGKNFFVLPEQDSYFYHFLLFGKRAWIDGNRGRIQKVLAALLRASQFAIEEPAAAQDIIAARFNLNPAFVRDTWGHYILEVGLLQTLISLMEQEVRWLVDNGLASAVDVPDFLSVIDYEPLLAVAPNAVQLIR